jgi:hypothetical protein
MTQQTPIASYLRHLIVTGIVFLAAKWQLPEAGLNDFAQGVALIVLGTGTWALVKYAPPGLKKLLGLGVIGIIAGGTFTGCAGLTASVSTPWGNVAHSEGGTVFYPMPIHFSSK